MVHTLHIPTINDAVIDFASMFRLYNQAMAMIDNGVGEIVFDFSNCRFLRPNAVAFIGGLAKFIKHHGISANFNWNSLEEKILNNLRQNGFTGSFGFGDHGWKGNSIPYREDKKAAPSDIMDYLTNEWLGKGWIGISPRLRYDIAGNVWEIYNNAFEHSASPIGIYTCGQHFPGNHELLLSIVDFGIGIPDKIRKFFLERGASETQVSRLGDAALLRWAFTSGNTTKGPGEGGLGLALLESFIKANHGSMHIYSNQGCAMSNEQGTTYNDTKPNFAGTFVHIKLRCDERLYKYRSET